MTSKPQATHADRANQTSDIANDPLPPPGKRGVDHANLVMIRDSGKPYWEFRVQCEVYMHAQKPALAVIRALSDPTSPDKVVAAARKVRSNVSGNACTEFKRIIDIAFDDRQKLVRDRSYSQAVHSGKLGTDHANLVMIRDSGKPYWEFRVQCEVHIDEESEALEVVHALSNPTTPERVRTAYEIVRDKISANACDEFRQIIDEAFDDRQKLVRRAQLTASEYTAPSRAPGSEARA